MIVVSNSSPLISLARVGRLDLGDGELATTLLARSLQADLALIDERSARRLAQASGLNVMGCVGVLETGHRRALLEDLRHVYQVTFAPGHPHRPPDSGPEPPVVRRATPLIASTANHFSLEAR